jgi:hypothetical protein
VIEMLTQAASKLARVNSVQLDKTPYAMVLRETGGCQGRCVSRSMQVGRQELAAAHKKLLK